MYRSLYEFITNSVCDYVISAAPTDVTAKAIDKSTIVVKWKLPEDPSVRVYRGVDVEYRQMNDEGAVVKQEVQRYAGRGNSLYIRALNPATTYQVQVRARTEVGEGIPSDVVMVTTDPESKNYKFLNSNCLTRSRKNCTNHLIITDGS